MEEIKHIGVGPVGNRFYGTWSSDSIIVNSRFSFLYEQVYKASMALRKVSLHAPVHRLAPATGPASRLVGLHGSPVTKWSWWSLELVLKSPPVGAVGFPSNSHRLAPEFYAPFMASQHCHGPGLRDPANAINKCCSTYASTSTSTSHCVNDNTRNSISNR